MNKNVLEMLNKILPQGSILLNEPMKDHTTFRIGGDADCMLRVGSIQQLQEILPLLRAQGEKYFLLGNGSNLLVSDEGFRGTVLQLTGEFSEIAVDEDRSIITAGAGALLSETARTAADHALSGMEFAAGIPGTVGGAAVMNAGAYGGEMSQVVQDVTIMTPEGDLLVLSCEGMDFGYRTSKVKCSDLIIIAVTFKLQLGDREQIFSVIRELAEKRREKQPLEYPSAGSTFKRPEGTYAGKLIMDCGLKGYQVGGAQVSEKHCGFVVNRGNATAKDVKTLMGHIQTVVARQTGIMLEKEIIFLE